MDKQATEIKNISIIGWIPCQENNYPIDGDNDVVIIAIFQDDRWYYWKYEDCPYGWNVLCDSEAYYYTIRKPYHYDKDNI